MVPNAEVNWSCRDGDHVQKGEKFGSVRADAGDLLKAERIALNFMQRMSGIATATSDMQRECEVWPMCAELSLVPKIGRAQLLADPVSLFSRSFRWLTSFS